jgi:hypothetical protein
MAPALAAKTLIRKGRSRERVDSMRILDSTGAGGERLSRGFEPTPGCEAPPGDAMPTVPPHHAMLISLMNGWVGSVRRTR